MFTKMTKHLFLLGYILLIAWNVQALMVLLYNASLTFLINIAESWRINITRHYRISLRRKWAFLESRVKSREDNPLAMKTIAFAAVACDIAEPWYPCVQVRVCFRLLLLLHFTRKNNEGCSNRFWIWLCATKWQNMWMRQVVAFCATCGDVRGKMR